jgi:hypothetical protein
MVESEALVALMDTLLPGGDGFPSASATGMAVLFVERLRAAGDDLPGRFLGAIAAHGGAPGDAEGWRKAAERLEAAEPKLFDDLRKYAYLTYYEQPMTIAAIRALGIRYNTTPLPEGYPADPFEKERDAPRHERGRWVATDEVRRVDLGRIRLEMS